MSALVLQGDFSGTPQHLPQGSLKIRGIIPETEKNSAARLKNISALSEILGSSDRGRDQTLTLPDSKSRLEP